MDDSRACFSAGEDVASSVSAASRTGGSTSSCSQGGPLLGSASSLFGHDSFDSQASGDSEDDDYWSRDEPGLIDARRVTREVAYQASSDNFHTHLMTCHKGSQGKVGCRLACPAETRQATAPVQLLPRMEDDDPLEPAERPRSWKTCLLYTSPSPRDRTRSRMPSSA